MAGRVDWHGAAVLNEVRSKVVRKLHASAITVLNRARTLVSVPGTAPAKATTGQSGRRARRGRVYGAERSKPGEPPRKQYGMLRRSLDYEVLESSLTARVGSNYKVARYLEMGTRRLAPRPFLRPALSQSRTQIDRIFSTP